MLYVNPLAWNPGLRTPAASDTEDPTRRHAALQELERYFVYSLLQEMRRTLDEAALAESPREKALVGDLLDDALSGAVAQSGQFGLAQQIERDLIAAEAMLKVLPHGKPTAASMD